MTFKSLSQHCRVIKTENMFLLRDPCVAKLAGESAVSDALLTRSGAISVVSMMKMITAVLQVR